MKRKKNRIKKEKLKRTWILGWLDAYGYQEKEEKVIGWKVIVELEARGIFFVFNQKKIKKKKKSNWIDSNC